MIRPAPATGPPLNQPLPDVAPEVFVTDEQSDQQVDVARWHDLALGVLDDEGVTGPAELSVQFVDEAAMAELNARFMGGDGPTDVLAFPIDEDEVMGDQPRLLGDIVVCPAVAARNAPDHAGTYDDELALLVVHGTLHVLGHDHADADQTVAMQSREQELLTRHHRSYS